MKRKEIFEQVKIDEILRALFSQIADAKAKGATGGDLARAYLSASVALDTPIAEIIDIFGNLSDEEKEIISGEFVGEIPTSESEN